MTPEPPTYPGYRFLAERGVIVTRESVRQWCLKFGADFARRLRRRRPEPGDTWHLDEVVLRINGALHYLWRAVDQNGVVLDILVQDRRNAAAAKRFSKRLLAGLNFAVKAVVHLRIEAVARILAPSYRVFPDRTAEEQMRRAYETYGVFPAR